MDYRFLIDAPAELDYRHIVEGFLRSVNFPENARNKARAMREQMRKVAQFPYRFPRVNGDFWNGRNAHYQVIDNGACLE